MRPEHEPEQPWWGEDTSNGLYVHRVVTGQRSRDRRIPTDLILPVALKWRTMVYLIAMVILAGALPVFVAAVADHQIVSGICLVIITMVGVLLSEAIPTRSQTEERVETRRVPTAIAATTQWQAMVEVAQYRGPNPAVHDALWDAAGVLGIHAPATPLTPAAEAHLDALAARIEKYGR